MKQNNRKKTWKAIVAVVLVMASLFSISTAVSAGFVQEVFEEVCVMMSSSSVIQDLPCYPEYTICVCGVTTFVTWHCMGGCKANHTSKPLGDCRC